MCTACTLKGGGHEKFVSHFMCCSSAECVQKTSFKTEDGSLPILLFNRNVLPVLAWLGDDVTREETGMAVIVPLPLLVIPMAV